jgi:multiple sugar transport system ATP-binding protein
MADLKITALHKRYGTVHAVRGIDLEIPAGEFTVLVGPSGCGKSTLLRTIAGLEAADAGTIEIAGRVVNYVRPRDRDIAMVFQNYALYPYMNVFENIAFGLRARKTPSAETGCRANSRAASASESPSAGPLCGMRGCSCSTSRCPTWMPSCATRCAARSSGSTRRSARP